MKEENNQIKNASLQLKTIAKERNEINDYIPRPMTKELCKFFNIKPNVYTSFNSLKAIDGPIYNYLITHKLLDKSTKNKIPKINLDDTLQELLGPPKIEIENYWWFNIHIHLKQHLTGWDVINQDNVGRYNFETLIPTYEVENLITYRGCVTVVPLHMYKKIRNLEIF